MRAGLDFGVFARGEESEVADHGNKNAGVWTRSLACERRRSRQIQQSKRSAQRVSLEIDFGLEGAAADACSTEAGELGEGGESG
jgi:hypothetical protein